MGASESVTRRDARLSRRGVFDVSDYVPKVVTSSLVLANRDAAGVIEEVVEMSLGGNNDKPQRNGRLHIGFRKDYSSEVEVECGPDLKPGNMRGNSIISQLMQWGPQTESGTGRNRLTVGIYTDSDKNLEGKIDSTTNDASGSPGQLGAMPVTLNVGEANGSYVTMFADKRLHLHDADADEVASIAELIAAIRKAR